MAIDRIVAIAAAVLFATTAIVLVLTMIRARRSGTFVQLLRALAAVLAVAALGVLWSEIALRSFANGSDVRGLIAHPLPNTTDHVFTKNGSTYLLWSFGVPMSVTFLLLAVITIAGTVNLFRLRSPTAALAVLLFSTSVVALISIYWVKRLVVAVDLFI